MKHKILSLAGLGLVLALIMVVLQLSAGQNAQAAPPLAPTPVANILGSQQNTYFRFQPATALTADTNTNSIRLDEFNSIDIQYVIDQGTVNTTTLTIQYSNDGTNWVNGVALVTNSVADGSDITRVPMFGRYARINQNLTNSNAITITLTGLAK